MPTPAKLSRELSTQSFLTRALMLYAAVLVAAILYFRQFALGTALPMNYDRSIFWAINALTCTGFRVTPNGLVDFATAGRIGVYLCSMFGAAFAMTVGGVLVCRLAGLRHSPARVVAASLVLLIAGSVLGTLPLLQSGRSLGAAVFEASAALTHLGMSLDMSRDAADWRLQLVTVPLAALAALSIPVLLDVYDRIRHKRPLSDYAHWVLRLYAAMWLASFAVLVAMNFSMPWRENVLTSWAWTINARSVGSGLNVATSRPIWAATAVLMLIGAPLGGAGGGLRLTPLSIIWRGSALGDELDRRRFGAALPGAAAWVATFVSLYALLATALLTAEPQATTDRLLVVAAGALGNTGLSDDVLSLSTRGMIVTSVGMLAGYLLPLRFAAWIVPAAKEMQTPRH